MWFEGQPGSDHRGAHESVPSVSEATPVDARPALRDGALTAAQHPPYRCHMQSRVEGGTPIQRRSDDTETAYMGVHADLDELHAAAHTGFGPETLRLRSSPEHQLRRLSKNVSEAQCCAGGRAGVPSDQSTSGGE
jgi:hypothetical protein